MIRAKVRRLAMDSENLVFDTDNGIFAFYVDGDCCSHSYFYDFYGVEKLLENGPITEVEEIALDNDDIQINDYDYIQVYGYRLITENAIWGEQSSVFSFRNSSNGYYGGWMEPGSNDADWENFLNYRALTTDITLD